VLSVVGDFGLLAPSFHDLYVRLYFPSELDYADFVASTIAPLTSLIALARACIHL